MGKEYKPWKTYSKKERDSGNIDFSQQTKINNEYEMNIDHNLLDDPHYQSAEKLARKQTMKSIRTNKFDPNNKETN